MRRGRRLGAGGTGPLLVLVARRDTYIAASLEAQRRRAMFVHFRQKQLGSFETCHLAQGRFIHQQIVQLARPIGQVHRGKNCAAIFLLRRTTMRAVLLAATRVLVHFRFAFFACPVGHIGTSHTRPWALLFCNSCKRRCTSYARGRNAALHEIQFNSFKAC